MARRWTVTAWRQVGEARVDARCVVEAETREEAHDKARGQFHQLFGIRPSVRWKMESCYADLAADASW